MYCLVCGPYNFNVLYLHERFSVCYGARELWYSTFHRGQPTNAIAAGYTYYNLLRSSRKQDELSKKQHNSPSSTRFSLLSIQETPKVLSSSGSCTSSGI